MAKKTSIFSNKKLIMFFLFMIIILPLFEPYLKIHEGLLDFIDPSLAPILFLFGGMFLFGGFALALVPSGNPK